MKNVYIVGAKRTPIGSFQGALSNTPAPRLGAVAIKAALAQSNVSPSEVQECIMGEVLTAGVGQAPARQAAIYSGLPNGVECLTINKVCGSGLKAVMLGADQIRLGAADVVVAGGQENMSMAPHIMPNSRAGYRMGNVTVQDSMLVDGLWDPYNNWHMGSAAELCVKEYKFTREEQDTFAIDSYKKAQKSLNDSVFKEEIAGVEVTVGKEKAMVEVDEEPGKARFEKMAGLRAAFDKEGTITAANASKINDGAAAIVLVSEEKLKEKGLKPLARIIAYGAFAHDPKWFTTAPVTAINRVLEKADMKADQIDLWEINEAFANVTMAAMRDIKIPAEKVNVAGGAVALGHPIGASGARLLTTLTYNLKRAKKRFGLATLCIGGGEAVAMIIESL